MKSLLNHCKISNIYFYIYKIYKINQVKLLKSKKIKKGLPQMEGRKSKKREAGTNNYIIK
jgi:hypothetical protein